MTKAKKTHITPPSQDSKAAQSAFLDVQDEISNFRGKVAALFELLSAANKNALSENTLAAIGELGLQIAEQHQSTMDRCITGLRANMPTSSSN